MKIQYYYVNYYVMITFDYQNPQKPTCINKIFMSLFKDTNIPHYIVEEIKSFLFTNTCDLFKIIYENKCEDYRQTRETYYNCLTIHKYDFIFQFMKSMLFKYLYGNDTFILPYLRQDIHFMNTCHLYKNDFIINEHFIKNNQLVILCLFIELYQDFQYKNIYFCMYTINEEKMNNKYFTLIKKIFIEK